MIRTVLGDVLPDDMTWCQCHEHVFIDSSIGKPLDDFSKSLAELKRYKKAGGDFLVDAQPIGAGRMEGLLGRVSCESGVSIIASTGFHKLMYYSEGHWIFDTDEKTLSDIFISEINEGMLSGGNISFPEGRIEERAGIIKTALDISGIEGIYEKLFYSAFTAAGKTGANILCHIDNGSDPDEFVNMALAFGLRPSSLILCHMDRADYNIRNHIKFAEMGIWLEYDTIGRPKYHSDMKEAKLISAMTARGFEDNILLGLDMTAQRAKHYMNGIGLDHILRRFQESLADAGLRNDIIRKFMKINPAKALALKNI